MKKILFMGMGHLGRFFLDEAIKDNLNVTATYRSFEKIKDLQERASLVYYQANSPLPSELKSDWDAVIISFPPLVNYPEVIKKIAQELPKKTHFLFISSTSVYAAGEITESSPRNGKTANALELINAENILQKLENSLIIRPGGLIDAKRSPAKYLHKKGVIKNSKDLVNIVHTKDIARFCTYAIKKKLTGDFNLVTDDHPSKESFYSRLIKEKFQISIRKDHKSSQRKSISNKKVLSTGFSFEYPHTSLFTFP